MHVPYPVLWCEVLIKNALAKALPDVVQAGLNENLDALKEGDPSETVNAKPEREATITPKRLQSSRVIVPIKARSTKHWLRELAPLCLGMACSEINGAMSLAVAAPLASLPKTVETQSHQFPTPNDKAGKACASDATLSPWSKLSYYWNQEPCASELPEATTQSDLRWSTTRLANAAALRYASTSQLTTRQVQNESPESATTLTLTPNITAQGSFNPASKAQELEQFLPHLNKEKTATPPLETWKTLVSFSSQEVPSKLEKGYVTPVSPALALNEALSVKPFSASPFLPVWASNDSQLPKQLVFQSAALLTGDYKRAGTSEITNNRKIESELALSPPAFSASGSNPSCPPPLIACAPSLQAQTPPPAQTVPPVAPENLRPNPNQDRFLQPPPSPAPLAPATPAVQPTPTPTPSVEPTPDRPAIQVQKINVTGSTIFGNNQINAIVQPFEGRTLTLEQLREVADAITQLYLNQGYITSRAIIVDQAISNGVVEIRVLEGSLEEIRIEGGRRVNANYIRSRVQLGAKTPLNTAQLEDQLRLLRADPLFENVEASLRAGTGTGQSILIVRVTEANPFEGSVGVDNYSPPSVGSERLGLNLLYRNLTGNGDAIAGSFYRTTQGGADSLDLSYRLPVNAMNGALQLRTSLTRNNIIDPTFRFLGIEGNSQLYEISFQQPLIRSPREEFSLSLGFAYQESQSTSNLPTSIFGPVSPGANAEGVTKTSVIRFGQDYLRRDVRGAWSMRSLFSLGTGLFDATTNSPPVPDGRFFSWLGQVQRVQILGDNNFLIAGIDVQLTPNRLLPSQQFVIGGGQSLRGYRQNIRAGDNGVRFSLEDRIALERNEAGNPIFQLAPFFDAGVVWNNDSSNRPLPEEQFLAGVGLGIIWEPIPKLSLRLDYGYPLIKIQDKGTNAQDEGFYFNVRYQF